LIVTVEFRAVAFKVAMIVACVAETHETYGSVTLGMVVVIAIAVFSVVEFCKIQIDVVGADQGDVSVEIDVVDELAATALAAVNVGAIVAVISAFISVV
jgi:hypothetical protein